ncbi:MAG TPA: 50S ribosomal protein L4 [Candidatus Woesebacteria bacterium]|nr:50S ribosomal protein L4 [Candidatus Woesebacteria bacterium]
MQLSVIDSSSKNEKVRVSDTLFANATSDFLLAQAIRIYLSNARQGTAHTKTRSEINRTKKKWYKQKGTGNARHGARTPSLFVGGGVAFGPRGIENWHKTLTAKLKLLALKAALSAQKTNLFLSKNISLQSKTSEAATLLSSVSTGDEKILIILTKNSDLARRSLRNLNNVLVMTAERVNALHVAMADKIVIDFAALKVLEDRLLKVKKSTLKK